MNPLSILKSGKVQPVYETFFARITPNMAKAIKKENTFPNRSIVKERVIILTDEIDTGNFITTHEGFLISKEKGWVGDGGHRIDAIAEGNTPVIVQITVVPEKDFEKVLSVTNIGRKRTLLNQKQQLQELNPAYEQIHSNYAPIANVIEFGVEKFLTPPPRRQLEIILKHAEVLELACKFPKALKFGAIPRGVIGRAAYTQDPEKLFRFMEVYHTQLTRSPKENAAIVLRKFLQRFNPHGWLAREEAYLKTESAVMHFINEENITKIYGIDRELFPIP